MISRATLKNEIDHVAEEHLDTVYRILLALARPLSLVRPHLSAEERGAYLRETFGSTSDAPLERWSPGALEVRRPLE